MEDKKKSRGGWGKKLRAQFMAGILVVVPVSASILILIWIFTTIDDILQPIVRAIAGHSIPGVGFGVTVVIIYLAGVIVRNVIGKRLMKYGDSLMMRVPVFRGLYTGIRQIVRSVTVPDKTGFMQVVLVEFPRKEMWTLGFVTKEMTAANGEKLINILIPTSPTPWSGFFQIVKEKDIIRTQISIEDAVKMIVSGGMNTPPDFQNKINI
jgi:uncharacterized membrane protein